MKILLGKLVSLSSFFVANALLLTLLRMNLLFPVGTAERPLGGASLSSLVDARQCIYAQSKSVDVCVVHAHDFVIAALFKALVCYANNTRLPRRFCALTERRMRLRALSRGVWSFGRLFASACLCSLFALIILRRNILPVTLHRNSSCPCTEYLSTAFLK